MAQHISDIKDQHSQEFPEPDVECEDCGRLIPISEVENVERDGRSPMGRPMYFCESCDQDRRED